MDIQSKHKISLSILILSIAFNFIVIKGLGNIYLSTMVVFTLFSYYLLITQGSFLKLNNSLLIIVSVLLTFFVTIINVMFFEPEIMNQQMVASFIYLQNGLVFVLASYFMKRVSLIYFFKLFLIASFVVSVRIVIEEPYHIFKLSVLWGERIEAYFVGGVNNFAFLCGIAFLISFYFIKHKMISMISSIYFFVAIILSMSRGALFGIILCLLISTLYGLNKKTIIAVFKYSFWALLSGILFILVSGKMDEIIEQINMRFFSLFTGEMNLNDFFSGRGSLISAMYEKMIDSNVFQIIFGHGNGSINFFDNDSIQFYETSHNFLIDILYKNGLIALIIYLIFFAFLILKFSKGKRKEKLPIFSIFVFFHLELLVNPLFFAAQTGWLYALFVVIFLYQNKKHLCTTETNLII